MSVIRPIAKEVALVREEREDCERPEQDHQPADRRNVIPRALDRTGDARLSLAALLGLCDPVVDANLLPVEGARRLRYLGRHASLAEVSVAHRAHTFWITGDPSSPLGRMRNMMMRSANT